MSLFSHSQDADATDRATRHPGTVRWEPVNSPWVGLLVLSGIALGVWLARLLAS